MRLCAAVLFALLVGIALPFVIGTVLAQQQDPKYLLAPLQAQRDRAANEAALCGADIARLQEELAALKARMADLEKKPDPK